MIRHASISMDDKELEDLKLDAKAEKMSVSAYARGILRNRNKGNNYAARIDSKEETEEEREEETDREKEREEMRKNDETVDNWFKKRDEMNAQERCEHLEKKMDNLENLVIERLNKLEDKMSELDKVYDSNFHKIAQHLR